jgi:hypothetical protein
MIFYHNLDRCITVKDSQSLLILLIAGEEKNEIRIHCGAAANGKLC